MSDVRVIDLRAGFAHCQIVIGESIVVIDPGNAEAVFAALARESIPIASVRQIFLTHGDGDHWGGANALSERSGAPVAAHEAERPYLDGTGLPRFSLPKRLLIATAGRRARRPSITRWLRHGETIAGLEVIHSPGHTPGHICLRSGRTLFAGDAFSTGETFKEVPRMMSADVARSRESIRALARLDIARAFSGHAPPSDDAGERLRGLAARLPAA